MLRRIFAVIVLYETKAMECLSLNSFLRAAEHAGSGTLAFEILLYDNSPRPASNQPALPPGISYIEDKSNSGLATAYNRALQMAIDRGYPWLLTLDQDSEIPLDGLSILCDAITAVEQQPEVGAIVPQIVAGGQIVSPNYFRLGAWPVWLPAGYVGIPDETMFAFNSGALLRVSALRQAGGYSPWFWMDNSDSNLFRQLAKLGKRVYVAGGMTLQHDFSMMNMQQKVSPARYEAILLAESAFWDREMNGLAGLERTARLAGRMVKHFLRRDSSQLKRLTRRALLLRLLRSRRYRIARWQLLTAPVIARFPASPPATARPRVSVCMAAYNGANYIREQLQSIAPQLTRQDEIIIVDDASQDGTPAIIEQFRRELATLPDAPVLRFSIHRQNRGVVHTFEDAIRAATGDILFLSDDDDRWAPSKVAAVLQAFAADEQVKLVSTHLELMDEHGQKYSSADFMRRRPFSPGVLANFLHNRFQGSALAFRSSLLQYILPFPKRRLFLHDAWIGLRTRLSGSKVVHLEEPLLFYRRHQSNFSQRLSFGRQLKLRLQLAWDLARASLFRS